MPSTISPVIWFVDSSVILRGIVDKSTAVRTWFASSIAAGDPMVGSQMLELEVRRVTRNAKIPQRAATDYLRWFALKPLDSSLVTEAIALKPPLGSADSLHLASAIRIGTNIITLATHDAQLANAAKTLKIKVHDPVTDDPRRPPVA